MFYCPECDMRFPLLREENESEEVYTSRLLATLQAPCSRCGLICEKCIRVGSDNA